MTEPLVPNDLSEKQLKWGYWFVTHKLKLRLALEIVLAVFSAVALGFSLYYIGFDILNAPAREAQLVALVKSGLNPAVALAQAPKPLALSDAQVLSTQGKFDLIGTISNPNQYFAARFSFRFADGSFASDATDEFILPGEQKMVAQLGVASATRPSGAALELVSVSWERIDRHIYPDWASFSAQHLNLPVTDIAYTPEIDLTGGKSSIGRTAFTITNDTGYGYHGVRALVVMSRGPAIVAVGSASFDTLAPNQVQTGEVTWYEDYGAVTQIKVFPEIDILNSASYIRAN